MAFCKVVSVFFVSAFVLKSVTANNDFFWLPLNKTIPGWDKYKYFENPNEDVIERQYVLQEQSPRTYLMCPQGFAIYQISAELLYDSGSQDVQTTSEKTTEATNDAAKHFNQTFQNMNKETNNETDEDKTTKKEENTTIGKVKVVPPKPSIFRRGLGDPKLQPCNPIGHCLWHQACVFNYGNEFCLEDLLPGNRKILLVNVTCLRDEVFESKLSENDVNEFRSKKDLILRITYRSKLGIGGKPINLNETKLSYIERPEDYVFHSKCPLEDPYSAGYRGQCQTLNSSLSANITERLWTILSRAESFLCHSKLVEHFCAFYFNSKGLCVPPGLLENGQVTNDISTLRYNERVYPKVRSRSLMLDDQPLDNSDLIPPKFGFILMVHKDAAAAIQLLETIYRPYNFYVIHVDKRQAEVRQEIFIRLRRKFIDVGGTGSNIRILPSERSFVTSWGSSEIYRAELEAYEELCRFKANKTSEYWDFAINLSGADLPIRDVDDLAMALATFRGHNFLSFHSEDLRNADVKSDSPPDPGLGLALDAWLSCDGFTYNVTRTDGPPTPDELKISSASQWAVLSRDLVQDLVDQERHPESWRLFSFSIHSMAIPDEFYIASFVFNSKHARLTHNLAFHWIKSFNNLDAYNLCRHLDDADFCGQGPSDIDQTSARDLYDNSNQKFFARKFNTNSIDDPSRQLAVSLTRHEYYQGIRNFLSRKTIEQLVQTANDAFKLNHWSTSKIENEPEVLSLLKLRIIPALQPSDSCCQKMFDRNFRSVQEYFYVLDFEAHGNEISRHYRSKFSFRRPFQCYSAGHLRAGRVTSWSYTASDGKDYLNPINYPWPHFQAGSESVYLELWFNTDDKILTSDCSKRSNRNFDEATPIFVDGLVEDSEGFYSNGNPIYIRGELIDPNGYERCTSDLEIFWTNTTIYIDRNNKKKKHGEMSQVLTFNCGPMEAGRWRVRFWQMKVSRPMLYEFHMTFLPTKAIVDASDGIDLLQSDWYLENVIQISAQEEHQVSRDTSTTTSTVSTSSSPPTSCPNLTMAEDGSLYNWCMCGGGLIMFALVGQFIFSCLIQPFLSPLRPYRAHKRWARIIFAVIAMVSVIQLGLKMNYCKSAEM